MIKIEDVLNHKLSECDRRILAEVARLQESLSVVESRVSQGGNAWGMTEVTTNRLIELLTERSTLRDVMTDLTKVANQEKKP